MPNKKESWSDYAKRLAAGKLGLAAAYALSSQNPKRRKSRSSEKKKTEAPKKTDSVGVRAGKGLARSRDRYEEAARMSRGGY